MRTVIARIFDYSLDGVVATEGTPFFDFCRARPDDPAQEERNRGGLLPAHSLTHLVLTFS